MINLQNTVLHDQALVSEYCLCRFDTAEDQEEYWRLIDIVIRTGSTYTQPFQNSSDGLTDLYPELLMLDADPPLYVQY